MQRTGMTQAASVQDVRPRARINSPRGRASDRRPSYLNA